ncbi:XRE family transcriptional regulator [Yersinia mollaretii]|uniref:helix-turn-helix domain-containing protein n=1 Tax=Yersinia mollaretii TaxID=33060 RepID=UPI0005E2AC2F|nr:helix-turn-helix domain-containing protein [Yersinia mollaretii]CNJ97249.1 XRE family transcriptional regulator [Yersinia mollaretii]
MKRKLSDEDLQAAERLRAIWNYKRGMLGLTQEKAADIMGYNTQGAVSHYLNGVTPLNTDAVIKFASLLMVSPEEIRPELSELFSYVRKGPPPPSEHEEPGWNHLTSQHKELIRLFNKLPESEKVKLLQQLEVTTENYDKLLEELLVLRRKSSHSSQ